VLPIHIGLVDETGEIADELAVLSSALNEQLQHDFAPVWHVAASTGAYRASQLPSGCWAVRVQTTLDDPNALGYHTDENGQPYSLVMLTNDYAVTVSHEVLEMLADPFGSRKHQARLPDGLGSHYQTFGLKHESSRVAYLVEVCDPCEARTYPVGGIELSDFVTSYWYRTADVGHVSVAGGCTAPRQVAADGYCSFESPPGSNDWWQVFNERGSLQVHHIGAFDRVKHGTLREFTDYYARLRRSA
jgi:hypothetical protein